MIFRRGSLRLRSYLKASLQDSEPPPGREAAGSEFLGPKAVTPCPQATRALAAGPQRQRPGRDLQDAGNGPARAPFGKPSADPSPAHPRQGGTQGHLSICAYVSAGGRRCRGCWRWRPGGPCTHPAPVRPGLNLPGTHHFPGLPSHLENRVEPKGLPDSGQPGPPLPSVRAQPSSRPGAGSAVQLCPSVQRAGRAASTEEAPVQGWVFTVTDAPHASQEARPQNTDGPDASHAGPGPHTQQRQEGRRLPIRSHRNTRPVAWQPQLIPDGEPEARFTALGELGTHWVSGCRAQITQVGLKAAFPPGGSGCAAGARLGYFGA